MIRLLCPAARCYLTASYTSSPPTSVLLTPPSPPPPAALALALFSRPPISSLFGERVSEEELLWSTRDDGRRYSYAFVPRRSELIAAFLTSIHCRVPADDVGMSG